MNPIYPEDLSYRQAEMIVDGWTEVRVACGGIPKFLPLGEEVELDGWIYTVSLVDRIGYFWRKRIGTE